MSKIQMSDDTSHGTLRVSCAQAVSVLGVLLASACGGAVESAEFNTLEPGTSETTVAAEGELGVARQAYTYRRGSGCLGHYSYRTVSRQRSSEDEPSSFFRDGDVGGEFNMEKRAGAPIPSLARERARRAARDAIAECGRAHYEARFASHPPAACDDAENYPFQHLKNALVEAVCRHGSRGDRFQAQMYVTSDESQLGCQDHYSYTDEDGSPHTVYYDSVDILTGYEGVGLTCP